jgi:hypothetical protein
MPQPDPTRTNRLTAYQRSRAAETAAHDDAARVIERWNAVIAAGRDTLWSPTIRCAIIADMPWLDVYCAGCRTSRAIDIRSIDRHPLASGLILGLRCSWCHGSGPMPMITGLHAFPLAVNRTQSAV